MKTFAIVVVIFCPGSEFRFKQVADRPDRYQCG